MDTINKLIKHFSEFPGIGQRQAKRFVYYILARNGDYTRELTDLILTLKKESVICSTCFRFFLSKNNTQESVCNICKDFSRDHSYLMVVPRDFDFEAIEKSGSFQGVYFILGGSVPILEKEPEKRIRIKELVKIIENKDSNLKEIIIAVNATPDGENTADYVMEKIKPISESKGIKISLLGKGLSTGAELEYVDPDTISNALKNRG